VTIDPAVALNTLVPISLLAGAGLLARATGVLRAEDPRVLNAYLYWFALPALFVVDLSRLRLGRDDLPFLAACVLPLVVAAAVVLALAVLLRLSRRATAFVLTGTVFGSLAFFGIPFVIFARPGAAAEALATLAAATASVPAVLFSIAVLEYARLEGGSFLAGLRAVARGLARNPLILSIAAGLALSLLGLRLPGPVERPLHMLGTTTATVAFFMLGATLWGRSYEGLRLGAAIALLRLAALPALALGTAAALGLQGVERDVAVLMHGMPVAVSMLVLSERYDVHPRLVASLVLISSLGAAVSLNLWLAVLGAAP
jgi:predicted permease